MENGLLIRPLLSTSHLDETVFYEDKNGFGIYCEKGLDVTKMIQAIKKLNGEN